MLTVRSAHPSEMPRLKLLWKKCFGDPDDYIDLYFRDYWEPDQALVVTEDENINAMGMVLPGELCFPGGAAFPAGYIYALATIPDRQGRGHARQLLDYAGEHIQAQGGKALVLVPASASLHRFFQAAGLEECFATRMEEVLNSALTGPGEGNMTPISPEEYNRFREAHLAGSFHFRYPRKLIAYQQANCRLSQGDLYRLETGGETGVASVEFLDRNSLLVKELLIPDQAAGAAVELLIRRTGVNRCHLRTPAFQEGLRGNYIQPFGMIRWYDETLKAQWGTHREAYLGLAFD